MKAVSDELKAHLARPVTALATLWRITRRDGVVQGFTDHDRDIVVGGLTYRAAGGFTPTTVESGAEMAVDNLEIEAVLSSEAIGEDDLLAGRYDGARVDVFAVAHDEPAAGMLHLRRGTIGEVRLGGTGFVAEVRGLAQALARPVNGVYSAACRADLGDGRCRVPLAAATVEGAVTAVTDARVFTDSARTEAEGWFAHGVLTWTSGANAGRAMEVRDFALGTFTLYLPMPGAVAVGDAYRVHAGCDRRFETCRDRFGNAVNFQGEPHVPGMDFLMAPARR